MEEKKIIIVIADYSMSPGPRYCNQGADSGEDFYHEMLNEKFADAFQSDIKLQVNLDGPDGYASSFLDEAFGNLVFDFGLERVNHCVEIVSDEEPEWIDMIEKETYLQWEQRRKEKKSPKKTEDHNEWYRYVNDNLKKGKWIQPS